LPVLAGVAGGLGAIGAIGTSKDSNTNKPGSDMKPSQRP
nr:hypothetical protein [Tanacetum cinerariifolium]